MEYLPDFTPLERIAITATGNLQRIISSFYNCPVTVQCVKNEKVASGVYDREVEISVLMKNNGDEPVPVRKEEAKKRRTSNQLQAPPHHHRITITHHQS